MSLRTTKLTLYVMLTARLRDDPEGTRKIVEEIAKRQKGVSATPEVVRDVLLEAFALAKVDSKTFSNCIYIMKEKGLLVPYIPQNQKKVIGYKIGSTGRKLIEKAAPEDTDEATQGNAPSSAHTEPSDALSLVKEIKELALEHRSAAAKYDKKRQEIIDLNVEIENRHARILELERDLASLSGITTSKLHVNAARMWDEICTEARKEPES